MIQGRVLVVDDDESLRRVTQMHLEESGLTVSTASNGERALSMLRSSPQDLVITDLKMPGISGLELLKKIRREHPEIVVFLITAYGTVESAVEAMKAGAYDYLIKPVHPEELKLCVAKALDHFQLLEQVRILRSTLDQKYGFENILGKSKALLSVLDQAARAARSNSTVLIHGETGTGKELLAKAIHFNSARKDQPFITINCGAIPKDLLESELFGYLKGSFTGAIAHKKGKVEAAEGGTLFFDEIGELPVELQAKLLRLIQEGEVEKVGGLEPVKVDVRILSATHRNLPAMVEDGAFREDLYYRLAVIPLVLPPLREREEDIPELVEKFFLKNRAKQERADLVLPPSMMPFFCRYRWPGNIRELENVIERMVVLSPGNELTLNDLPEAIRHQRLVLDMLQLELPLQGISLESVEKELILRALKKFSWNQTQTARYLDISRKTLRYRMEKYAIQKEPGESLPPVDFESKG
jgi:DNA-binding NtrC family response regulator